MYPTVAFVLPTGLVLMSLLGMMQVFLSDDRALPIIVPLLLVSGFLVLLHSGFVELRWSRKKSQETTTGFPGWALPMIGVVGGLVVCAQMAIYLANSLQDEPVMWFMHVPGVTAIVALAAMLHAAWRC